MELFFDIETVLMQNWIVWSRIVYMYKNGFNINNLQWLMCHNTKPNQTKPKKPLFEMVLVRCRWYSQHILSPVDISMETLNYAFRGN